MGCMWGARGRHVAHCSESLHGLDGNAISDEGVAALVEALEVNTVLTVLH